MEDEELAKSLLVTQQLVISELAMALVPGASASASASGVTAVLLLSAFVSACSAFAGGYVVSTINI